MYLSSKVVFNAAGAPVYMDEQKELLRNSQTEVDVYDGPTKLHDRRRGKAIVTTHRILFLKNSDTSLSACWHLRHVQPSVEYTPAGWISGAKVTISLSAQPVPEAAPGAASSTGSGDTPQPRTGSISFTFHGTKSGAEEFKAKLDSALHEQAWISEAPADVDSSAKRHKGRAPAEPQSLSALAGIGGLQVTHKTRLQDQKAAADAAFRDIASLEKHARAMVALVQRYNTKQGAAARATTAEGGAGAAAASGSGGRKSEDERLDSVMADLGIVNPVTKASAGQRYHAELAVQLAEFIGPTLLRAGGILQLAEVYARYNRARGTDLVSPDDVLRACTAMWGLGTGIRLHRLSSGVMVLETKDHDASAVPPRVVSLLRKRAEASGFPGGAFVGAAEIASLWKVSLPVALAYLEAAEAKGWICRDDSLHGVRFFETAPELVPDDVLLPA